MKKKDLKKLALFGITGGLMVASQGTVKADAPEGENSSDVLTGLMAASCGSHTCSSYGGCGNTRGGIIADADEDTKSDDSGQVMTEDQLMSQLNDQGKQMYKSLNPEGKAMAIKLASRSCKGTNACKGQNSCKSSMNSCAGKGSCAGTSQCSFKDKNLAVKVAAQHQAEKRANTNTGMYQPSSGSSSQTNSGSY